jgi:hypothetical protein
VLTTKSSVLEASARTILIALRICQDNFRLTDGCVPVKDRATITSKGVATMAGYADRRVRGEKAAKPRRAVNDLTKLQIRQIFDFYGAGHSTVAIGGLTRIAYSTIDYVIENMVPPDLDDMLEEGRRDDEPTEVNMIGLIPRRA